MRISRRLGVILAVSLGLNLFLGGMVASYWLFQGDDHHRSRGFFQREAARAGLSEEHRRAVDAVWGQYRPVMRGHIRDMRKARREVRRLLRADSLDAAALEKARKAYDTSQQHVRAAVRQAIDEISKALPDAERRQYFETGFKRKKRRRD